MKAFKLFWVFAMIAVAGVVGMTVDSLLGATVEGGRIGNQAVNFLATLSGAVAAGALASSAPSRSSGLERSSG